MSCDKNTNTQQERVAHLNHWLVWPQATGVNRSGRVCETCSLCRTGWGRSQRGPERECWDQKKRCCETQSWFQIQKNLVTRTNEQKWFCSPRKQLWYLHWACLAVSDHWRPSLNIDWLRDEEGPIGLVLGEVLQTSLIGLLVFVLIGQKNRNKITLTAVFMSVRQTNKTFRFVREKKPVWIRE